MKQDLQLKIEEFYKSYNNTLRPLLILVESELEDFPINILNEVRAIHDHVARVYKDGEGINKEEELKLCERHIQRAVLDCFKIIIAIKDKGIKRFKKDYKSVNLGDVDSGAFLPEFKQKLKVAKQYVKEAKKSECKGETEREKTVQLFEKATLKYDEVEEFIENNDSKLIWSVSNQRKRLWKSVVVSLIVAVIIGITVNLITLAYGIDIIGGLQKGYYIVKAWLIK
jgi:hypothetical protein